MEPPSHGAALPWSRLGDTSGGTTARLNQSSPPQVRLPPSVSVEFKNHATAMAMARRAPVASPPARGRAGVTEGARGAMRRSASLSQGSQSWPPPWQRPTGLHGLSSSFYRQ